jgi:hypothetical protein
VLTKPDTLQAKEEGPWLDIMNGITNPLALGYFMTKQPGQADVEKKLSYEDAREAEREFFDTRAPWCDLPQEARDRMGTIKLGEKLSKSLSDFIDHM